MCVCVDTKLEYIMRGRIILLWPLPFSTNHLVKAAFCMLYMYMYTHEPLSNNARHDQLNLS